MRLNIGPRLLVCFVLIILSMLAGDALVLWQFQIVRLQAERLKDYDQELVAVLRVHANLLAVHEKLEAIANIEDAGRLVAEVGPLNKAFVEDARRARSVLNSLPSSMQSDPSILSTLEVVDRTLESQFEEISDLATLGDWSAVRLRLTNQVHPLEFLTSNLVEKVNRTVSKEQERAALNIRSVRRRLLVVVPMTVIFTLLVAGTLGLAITRSITQPLARLVQGSKKLARGEFEYEVPVRGNDELSRLGQVFNDTARQLQDLYASLQNSEDRLRRVINTIPAYVWSAWPDGSVDFLNQQLSNCTGLSAEELLSSGWSSIVHADDLARYLKEWQEGLANGEATESEVRIRTAHRDYRWMLVRNVPLRDGPGNIIKWYGTGIDIEDRKHAEEALRASELALREMVNNIPGLVARTNVTGGLEFLNHQTLEYFGKSMEDMKGWTLNGAIHPDDVTGVIEARKKSSEVWKSYVYEIRCLRADGVYRWFQVRGGLPTRDASGSLGSRYLLLTDIEERRQAEEKLRQSEAFLAEAQNLSRIGSFSWLVATDEIKWSEQLYRIFEFEPGVPMTFDLIGSRVHPEDLCLIHDMIERAKRAVSEHEYEYRLLMPDRSIKRLHLTAHASRDREGRLEYIGAVQDVTQRQLAEEALNKARSELAHVARVTALNTLTASIAHEVNQPLSGIVTNASTCLRMLDANPPNLEGARETARRTIRDGNRASEVITRLRALFSKKGATFESFDLNDAAKEVIALSVSELQRNGVILLLDLASDLPSAFGDRVQIQQVILNLIRNSSDAMSGIDDRPRELLIKTEREENDQVRLTVKDAGVGINPEIEEKLFEAFHTTKGDGMGIGLSVSRSIMESHQGRLWAIRNEGPGATFIFSIPCSTNT